MQYLDYLRQKAKFAWNLSFQKVSLKNAYKMNPIGRVALRYKNYIYSQEKNVGKLFVNSSIFQSMKYFSKSVIKTQKKRAELVQSWQ